ncbi:hypothetical protein NEAUS03_0175 [Nematocida ausubeli]|nr:hypothetical protein NEAUS03_0175 [Nematocida ausubeli]
MNIRTSDIFSALPIRISADGSDEHDIRLSKSQMAWLSLSKQFLNTVPYSEQIIQTEAHLEAARKDLQEKGVIIQERIEPKAYTNEYSIKGSVLQDSSNRLLFLCKRLQELEETENTRKSVIKYFWKKEYITRKENDLLVHIHNKVFISCNILEKGLSASYIEGILYINGVEHKGYLKEKEVHEFKQESFEELKDAIHEYRDRLNSTEILQEYVTENERFKVRRIDKMPDTQSKLVIFMLCALKEGISFSKAVNMVKNNK